MRALLPIVLRRKSLMIGAVLLLILVALALLAPVIAPYHPYWDGDLHYSELSPSWQYWMGTDAYGRDVLSRVLYGARVSLSVGLVTQLVNTMIGILLGLTAGYFGGWWDDLVSAATNMMLSIPSLIFALAIMALLGPGLTNIIIALSLTNWSYTCRITRSQTLAAKHLGYVRAGHALGFSHARIMLTQVLPNILGPILVIATLGIGSAILMEASLSFLGLGVQPPEPSWGSMLSNGVELFLIAPWASIFPGIALFLTVLSLNLTGDGLRDLLDPQTAREVR